MIDKLLKYFFSGLNKHLSDKRLESLFCHEGSLSERLTAHLHLTRCWYCRIRRQEYEEKRTSQILDFCHDVLDAESPEWPLEPAPEFAYRLEHHLRHLPQRRRWIVGLPKIPVLVGPLKNSQIAAYGIFASITVVTIFFWYQHRAPNITPNTLLVRAEQWDSSNPSHTPGVAYQSVRITAAQLIMERAIYRDLEGKRRPKQVKLVEGQEKLKVRLTDVGVNWNEPISASDYQTWHDHQHIRRDEIDRVGAHLLKLTTTVPDSAVSSQSLTVRDTDFHPIQRTIAFRDQGLVEIAELDFQILPLASVGADVFESADVLSLPLRSSRGANSSVLPELPQVVTQEKLDEAELSARLMLNHLHADDGEQIEVRRVRQQIVVEGVVATDDRKRVLQAQLSLVPHVTIGIQTEAESRRAPMPESPTEVQAASMPYVPSLLEMLLEAQGRSVSDANNLAMRIANAALTISQESKAIVDLQTRFDRGENLAIVASATLSELLYSHRERLTAAVKSERLLIAEAQHYSKDTMHPSQSTVSSLLDDAGTNLALSKELTQTTDRGTRDAEQILAEMTVSINDLTLAANDIYRKSQEKSSLSGKK